MPRKTSTKTAESSRSGNSAGRARDARERDEQPEDQHGDLDDDEQLDVEPEPARTSGNASAKSSG